MPDLSSRLRTNTRSMIKTMFTIRIADVLNEDEWNTLKENYPTLTGDESYETVLNLQAMKMPFVFEKDSDKLSATIHLWNRAHGLPKAEVDINNKLVQIEPLSEVEVIDISTKLSKDY